MKIDKLFSFYASLCFLLVAAPTIHNPEFKQFGTGLVLLALLFFTLPYVFENKNEDKS